MDGIHDLGGKQGYGPIDVDHGDHVAMADWEARMWAVAQTCRAPDWTTDWWRHITERIDPAVYLAIPYFEKWMLTYTTGLITSGILTLDDVIAGHTSRTGKAPDPQSVEDVMQAVKAARAVQPRENDGPSPAFQVGQKVGTLRDISADHTRLPAYAQGRVGHILAGHGTRTFPDLSAKGIEEPDHLYTIVFTAKELWGDEACETDTVRLDLWERYLVTA